MNIEHQQVRIAGTPMGGAPVATSFELEPEAFRSLERSDAILDRRKQLFRALIEYARVHSACTCAKITVFCGKNSIRTF